jgi:hypothetical protein
MYSTNLRRCFDFNWFIRNLHLVTARNHKSTRTYIVYSSPYSKQNFRFRNEFRFRQSSNNGFRRQKFSFRWLPEQSPCLDQAKEPPVHSQHTYSHSGLKESFLFLDWTELNWIQQNVEWKEIRNELKWIQIKWAKNYFGEQRLSSKRQKTPLTPLLLETWLFSRNWHCIISGLVDVA